MSNTPFYKRRKFWLVLAVCVVVLAAAGGFFYSKLIGARMKVQADTEWLIIKTGDTYEDVLQTLTRNGWIESEEVFDFLAQQAKYPGKVKAGKYKIIKGETYIDVIRKLRAGKQEEVKLVINAMITTRQVASIVGANLEADSIEFINMLEDSTYLAQFGFTPQTVLCLFVPNTYNFYWNTDAKAVFQRLKKEHDKFWNDKRKQQAAAQGLTPLQAGILASIVDGETNKTDEMGIVAGLYLNRLKKDMLLQADPTVKYAARNSGLQRVYNYHTQIQSPYNTYIHKGLPPGPLALPSQQAIQAVLTPANHNYIYMCAKEDLSGYHNFTDNLTQHNLNAARYRLELDKRGIK